MEPFPYRQNQTKFLIVLVSMFSLAICSLWGWIQVNEIASTKVQKMVSKLKNKSGIPVHIGHWRIGFGGAHFEDIVVGPNSEVVISEVSAELNLNPFSDYFGQLRHITIHRIQIKTDLERIASTRRQLAKKSGGPLKSQTPIDKLFRLIPVQRSLTIGSGNLRLINNDGNVIGAARGLKLRIDKKLKKIEFVAAAIKAVHGSIERNLSGNLSYDQFAGRYNFSLVQKRPSASNLIQGKMNKNWTEVDVSFNLKFAPQNLQHLLQEKGVDLNKFNLEGKISGTQENKSWRYQLKVKGRNLNFKHNLIANHRIGPLPFAINGHGLIEPGLGRFALSNATLHLPARKAKRLHRKVLIGLDLSVERQRDQSLKASGRVQLPRTNCQDILEISPKGLTPNLTGFKLAGQVQGNLKFDFSSDNLANFSYRIRQKHFGCSVVAMPYTYSAKHLRGPFSLEREVGKDDQPLEITLTPMSQGFSEFDAISPNVPIAFITSEDAGFWTHEGIDTFSIENAIRKNLEERRVAIGGSTITMQTVKNLFLTHRRICFLTFISEGTVFTSIYGS